MGMFSDLMGKIFRHGAVAERPHDAAPGGGAPRVNPLRTGAPGAASAARGAAPANVDVAPILDKLAKEHKEKLDWRHSIVDMMKLVGMDSSLAARKDLAADLRYSGDTNDSATMNMWLHKEVMKKLAENGGKVPPELLSR